MISSFLVGFSFFGIEGHITDVPLTLLKKVLFPPQCMNMIIQELITDVVLHYRYMKLKNCKNWLVELN